MWPQKFIIEHIPMQAHISSNSGIVYGIFWDISTYVSVIKTWHHGGTQGDLFVKKMKVAMDTTQKWLNPDMDRPRLKKSIKNRSIVSDIVVLHIHQYEWLDNYPNTCTNFRHAHSAKFIPHVYHWLTWPKTHSSDDLLPCSGLLPLAFEHPPGTFCRNGLWHPGMA